MTEFTIEGRTVTMPVEVRAAQNWIATYFVPADSAQELIEASGLEVAQARPGRAILGLGFVRYADTDLGAYDEFAFSVLVRLHDAGPATPRQKSTEVRKQRIGVYIHRLPVNDAFSLASGRGIWGYPKTMASFDMTPQRSATVWTLRQDGTTTLSLRFRRGFIPWMQKSAPPTYTLLDGTLRLTRWESHPKVVRSRLGGADITLGEGPIADELRSLGLPRGPLFSAHIGRWSARFSEAEIVKPGAPGVSSEKESGRAAQNT